MPTRAVSWICKVGTNQGKDPREKDQSASSPQGMQQSEPQGHFVPFHCTLLGSTRSLCYKVIGSVERPRKQGKGEGKKKIQKLTPDQYWFSFHCQAKAKRKMCRNGSGAERQNHSKCNCETSSTPEQA